jgi:hypothetical protein
MGIHQSPTFDDYWSQVEDNGPLHLPRRYMTQKRFEQIKRFLHISRLGTEDDQKATKQWWYKVEPLASEFEKAAQNYYYPGSNISIDETMIRCFGRTKHTIKMPNKPISQGYKIFALAEHGYIWTFTWSSRLWGIMEMFRFPGLSPTASMVLNMITKLPRLRDSAIDSAVNSSIDSAIDSAINSAIDSAINSAVDSAINSSIDSAINSSIDSAINSSVDPAISSSVDPAISSSIDSAINSAIDLAINSSIDSVPYVVYMDNYFTSVALFKELRALQCGACGTARPRSGIPNQLIELKEHIKSIPWGKLFASEDQGVLCLAWQDNNIVLLLSTIHSPDTFVSTKRKRPAATSTNAAIARAPFRDEVEKNLAIPTAINDYNHYMGGVDIANQYRASYETHRRTERNWFPLFYFFLDAAIVNAFRIQSIYKQQHQQSRPNQLDFRKKLYQELFAFVANQAPSSTANHQRIQLNGQRACVQCIYKRRINRIKGGQATRSRSGCLQCNIALCVKGQCWDDFHSSK